MSDTPQPPSAAAPWRSRPVFITSTFADMQAERDWLRYHVFPELAERLRERRHYLEPIDLRWGVETRTVDQQQAKELLVLKVCLEEINRSRPFLIGLVGDRYGWVPPPERMRAATDEAGYQTDVEGKSVTALEIEYGVLAEADPGNAGWQRGVTVSCYKLGNFCQQAGDGSEAATYWGRCRDILRSMRDRGMFLDPPAVQVLEQLERMF